MKSELQKNLLNPSNTLYQIQNVFCSEYDDTLHIVNALTSRRV